MLLQGSCHCGAVTFSVESPHPYPYQRCYCSICRKTAGGGGYAINLSGQAETLQVDGSQHKGIYHAVIDGEPSSGERHFCGIVPRHYGSMILIGRSLCTPLPRLSTLNCQYRQKMCI